MTRTSTLRKISSYLYDTSSSQIFIDFRIILLHIMVQMKTSCLVYYQAAASNSIN